MVIKKTCKDCAAENKALTRVADEPGPRCATHWRLEKKRRSLAAHGKSVEKTYDISEQEYWAIYESQGGKCYICQKASGTARRLAVDHNHETGKVRALLCKTCNYVVLGRYDKEALARAVSVLLYEPAQEVLTRLRTETP